MKGSTVTGVHIFEKIAKLHAEVQELERAVDQLDGEGLKDAVGILKGVLKQKKEAYSLELRMEYSQTSHGIGHIQ